MSESTGSLTELLRGALDAWRRLPDRRRPDMSEFFAARLIALGWVRLTPERLAEALFDNSDLPDTLGPWIDQPHNAAREKDVAFAAAILAALKEPTR